MGRKRKRSTPSKKNESGSITIEQQHDLLSTIRAVVDKEATVFLFRDFVGSYVPNLSLPAHIENEMIEKIAIEPSDSMKSFSHVKRAECRESVSSLVDGAVWSLVQRRERFKRLGKDGRNVLAQGYVLSTFAEEYGAMPSRGMRAGVLCNQPNDKVSFCKTSPIFSQLHSLLGDEVFRGLLLYSRLFVPVQDPTSNFRSNYMLVCGDHLRLRLDPRDNNQSTKQKVLPDEPKENERKKRRLFQTKRPNFLQPSASVSRHDLYYNDSYYPEVGLPQMHLLNKNCSEKALLCAIFKLDKKQSNFVKRWKRLREHGLEVAKSIIQGHRQCDYHRLLDRYCPLPTAALKAKDECTTSNKVTLEEVSASYTPVKQVSSFLKAILSRVVPNDYWGSEQNRNLFFGTLDSFLTLRRKEKLPNKFFMNGIRISGMSWLYGKQKSRKKISRSEHEAVSLLAIQAYRWVLESLVIPLLRATFYVTETEFGANLVVYYRKPVWSVFRAMSLEKLLKEQFVEIDTSEAISRLSSQTMGFSRLRLLPKATGVRPIAHLSRREKVSFEKSTRANRASNSPADAANLLDMTSNNQSTNEILGVAFDILKYEISRDPSSCGAGLDGLASFYLKYRDFLARVQNSRSAGDLPKLYFATVDIRKCYDTIDQKKLQSITDKRVLEQDYLVQQSTFYLPALDTQGVRRTTKKCVVPPEQYKSTDEVSSDLSTDLSGALFTDSLRSHLVSKESINKLLDDHLNSHLLVTSGRYGDRYLLQSKGISQGSVLSMLLCNLYYGTLETEMLPKGLFKGRFGAEIDPSTSRSQENSFVARMVDDFIFISTVEDDVKVFLQQMDTGKPDLGAVINPAKTLSNIVFSHGEEARPVNTIPSNSLKFPWCGMLLDTKTGHVSVDYSRFADGKALDGLTVDRSKAEGVQMKFRMQTFVRPRCLPILYDSFINSHETIVKNYYQMMLLGAVKTAFYLRAYDNTLNVQYTIDCIHFLSDYALQVVRGGLKDGGGQKLILTESKTSWLCWRAFQDVFSQLHDLDNVSSSISGVLDRKEPHLHLLPAISRGLEEFCLPRMIDF
jgi:telomerase reverse transcriptase